MRGSKGHSKVQIENDPKQNQTSAFKYTKCEWKSNNQNRQVQWTLYSFSVQADLVVGHFTPQNIWRFVTRGTTTWRC